jgi:hypothetical protein
MPTLCTVCMPPTCTVLVQPAGPTKLWLLFQAPDGELQSAPQGFTIRRAFNINLRKAFQVGELCQECARSQQALGVLDADRPLSSSAGPYDNACSLLA